MEYNVTKEYWRGGMLSYRCPDRMTIWRMAGLTTLTRQSALRRGHGFRRSHANLFAEQACEVGGFVWAEEEGVATRGDH